MDKFSIVIPTLWKSNRIGKLLFSLIECEFVDEIILIDNAGKFFENFEALDKVKLVQVKENIYVNPAWNLGVKIAKNNCIAILNDDINFNPNIFEVITEDILNQFGIIGMGEAVEDRVGLLLSYMEMETPPDSIPINALVAIEGTPLEQQKPIEQWELIRMVATTRIAFPESVVRLSAGRTKMSMEAQAMCFLAGAGSIFAGDKLLTTPNPEFNEDKEMFSILGLVAKEAFADGEKPVTEPDEKLLARKAEQEKRAQELQTAREQAKTEGFEPRKIVSSTTLNG